MQTLTFKVVHNWYIDNVGEEKSHTFVDKVGDV